MATLADGSAVTVTLPVGQALNFLPGGGGLVTVAGTSMMHPVGQGNVTVGPFEQPTVLTVQASGGALVYDFAFQEPAYTWATRPPVGSMPAGSVIWITDLPVGSRSRFRNDGTRWRPVDKVLRVARTVTPVSKSDANTTQGVIFSYTLPAGLMQVGDALEMDGLFEYPNSATTKTLNAYVISTAILNTAVTTTGILRLAQRVNAISNTQLVGFAHASVPFGGSANAKVTCTVDLSVGFGMSFTGTWGTAGAGSNNITCLSAEVVLITA